VTPNPGRGDRDNRRREKEKRSDDDDIAHSGGRVGIFAALEELKKIYPSFLRALGSFDI